MYEHETDKPKVAPKGKMPMNCHSMADFKADASDQAYGQGGKAGTMKDEGKIHAQFFSGAYENDGY